MKWTSATYNKIDNQDSTSHCSQQARQGKRSSKIANRKFVNFNNKNVILQTMFLQVPTFVEYTHKNFHCIFIPFHHLFEESLFKSFDFLLLRCKPELICHSCFTNIEIEADVYFNILSQSLGKSFINNRHFRKISCYQMRAKCEHKSSTHCNEIQYIQCMGFSDFFNSELFN